MATIPEIRAGIKAFGKAVDDQAAREDYSLSWPSDWDSKRLREAFGAAIDAVDAVRAEKEAAEMESERGFVMANERAEPTTEATAEAAGGDLDNYPRYPGIREAQWVADAHNPPASVETETQGKQIEGEP